MAAEKLTKQRLAQILFMMALLISAFIWRTIEHNRTNFDCIFKENCSMNINGHPVEFMWSSTEGQYLVVRSKAINTIEVVEGSALIEEFESYYKIALMSESVTLRVSASESSNTSLIRIKH